MIPYFSINSVFQVKISTCLKDDFWQICNRRFKEIPQEIEVCGRIMSLKNVEEISSNEKLLTFG